MINGVAEMVVHAAGIATFVVDSKLNPSMLAGHDKMTFEPEREIANPGCTESLNTVFEVIPYSTFPAIASPPSGPTLGKLYAVANPVPSVLTAKTVPSPQRPPSAVVP